MPEMMDAVEFDSIVVGPARLIPPLPTDRDANLLEALVDKKHPEHREMREWIGQYDSEEFDLEECNVDLASRFGASKPRKKVAKKSVKKTTEKNEKRRK